MKRSSSIVALLAASMLILSPVAVPSAQAVPVETTLNVVLLGDSYSAGNGAGSYEAGAEWNSYRSTISWGRNYVSWLNSRGVHTTLTNLAYNGYTTQQVLDNQIPNVPANADLVMLTIGGNDINFGGIVEQCFAIGFRDPKSCQDLVEKAVAGLPGVMSNTEKILRELSDKLGDDAQVVLVGYPLLSTTRQYELAQCYSYFFAFCTSYKVYDAGTAVRESGQIVTQQQQQLVDKWNAENSMKVTYIDSIASAFAGHEPDPSVLTKNDYRWVNEFLETAGKAGSNGKTQGKLSIDPNTWYHPNVTGNAKIAEEVENHFGVPSSTKPLPTATSDIDVAFVVNPTDSMSGVIDSVKDNVQSIADQVDAKSASYRFALVTYSDQPAPGDGSDNYSSELALDFGSDVTTFESALDELNIGEGSEPVTSGVSEALNLDWRPDAKKAVIVLGDAAPSVADMSQVETYDVQTGEDVPQMIVDAITTTLNKPFAWIQGPIGGYAGESITLDARGSYSVDEPIAQYEWDFNGDGVYDLATAEGLIDHVFDTPFVGTVGVRVSTADGQSADASASADIAVEPVPEPESDAEPLQDEEGVYEMLDGAVLPFNVAVLDAQEPLMSLSAHSVAQGGSVDVSGINLPPNTQTELWLSDLVKLADTTTDAAGTFTQTLAIPSDIAPAAYQIVARFGNQELASDLTVTGVNASPSPSPTVTPLTSSPNLSPTAKPVSAPTTPLVSASAGGSVLVSSGMAFSVRLLLGLVFIGAGLIVGGHVRTTRARRKSHRSGTNTSKKLLIHFTHT